SVSVVPDHVNARYEPPDIFASTVLVPVPAMTVPLSASSVVAAPSVAVVIALRREYNAAYMVAREPALLLVIERRSGVFAALASVPRFR
ncbi:hypothetical protein, partial [Pseudomonas alvandae]|uniref:hypothetical protein n=1 Tax=Pseudomonas canavaninivorans TaxID=2842348 RepID=UPI002B1E0656